MINIFIGSNDLCAVCDDDEARIVHNPDSWEEKVTQTIDYIQGFYLFESFSETVRIGFLSCEYVSRLPSPVSHSQFF